MVLLYERGRQMVYARGAVRPKSKFHASAQAFAFSEFVLYEGPNFLSLAQCQLVENFYGVRRDFERLCLAGHVLELAGNMLLPGMPCGEALRLIYLALSKLSAADYPPRLAAAAFELKLLQAEGFLDKILPGFSFSAEAEAFVRKILSDSYRAVFSFTAEAEVVDEVFAALDVFRRDVLNTYSKSLELLK